jgi:hypothetical protein
VGEAGILEGVQVLKVQRVICEGSHTVFQTDPLTKMGWAEGLRMSG